jgi:acyl-CoA thioester hydrolase
MAYEFQINRRVDFCDTDMAGIVHFSNYFRYMEAAETAFLRSLGLSGALAYTHSSFCLPRVHVECDYTAPLRFEDEVRIHLLVKKKGARTLTYLFRFHRLNGSQPQEVAHGKVVAVCAERKEDGTLQSVPLPKLIADKIQEAPTELLAGDASPAPHTSKTAAGHHSATGSKHSHSYL